MLFSSPFQPEPPHRHGQPQRTAVLYCNLGTPDEPTAPALRRYLAQFLGDARVVEIPKPLWWLILHGIILRFRPAKSAAKYASIWTPEGSPLKVWTERQAQALQTALKQLGHHVEVRYAMRYGQPAVAQQIADLKAQGVERVLVLPAYPQYSGTTTASVFDAVYAWASRTRWVPEFRFINRYYDDRDTPRDESYAEDVATAPVACLVAGVSRMATRAPPDGPSGPARRSVATLRGAAW